MTVSKRILHIITAVLLIFALVGVFYAPSVSASSVEMPYFYFKLTDDERLAYDAVRAAALSLKKTVDITPALTDESMTRISGLLVYYDADTYHVSQVDYVSNETISRFTIQYKYTAEDFAVKNEKIKTRVDTIVKAVKAQKSGYMKLVTIHDAIVKNCVFTTRSEYTNKSTMYGALIEGRANSFGYAEAFTYIAGKSGILSATTIGVTGKNTAAFNKVYHGGRWYNIDCAANDTPGRFRETPTYSFFMVPDSYMDSAPFTMYFTAPESVTGGMYYYRALKLEATDDSSARKLIANQIVAGNAEKRSTVSFSFADDASLEQFINTVSSTYYIVDTLDLVKKHVKNPIITDAADFTVNKKTRVVTVAIFYPDTKLSDYYTDTKGFTEEQLAYYKELGLT